MTAFDANSNTIRLVDDNGGTTAWAYDLQDRQTVMTFHDGSTRQYIYDLASDVITYTDENSSVFANTFDVLGRKTDVAITPAAGVAGHTGFAVAGTIAQGFKFDGLSRMTFARDTLSNGENYDCAMVYDSISRILEEPQTINGDSRYATNISFKSYPANWFTYPNGRSIALGFDALYRKNVIADAVEGPIAAWQFFGGRTAKVTLGNGIVTSYMNNAGTNSAVQTGVALPGWSSGDALGYDGSGRLIAKRHLNGSTVVVGNTTAYDPSGNKLFERAMHAESRSHLYASDSMDRLTGYQRGTLASGGGSITSPIALPGTDPQRSYTLDGLSNWTNTFSTPVGGSAELELRTHNKLNQIVAFGVAPASTPVAYDTGNNAGTANPTRGNGNFANDGTRTYIWDALNRLKLVNRVSDGAAIGAYFYDAAGRRIIRQVQNGGLSGSVPDSNNRYLLSGQRIVEEVNADTGSTTVQYVWGQYIDELVELKALTTIGPQPLAAGNYYLLNDLLYRSVALTNASKAIVETYDTDAYGNTLLFKAGSGGAWFTNSDVQAPYSACRFLFTGREYDFTSDTYYYRARCFIAPLGRFATRDPSGITAGPNLYCYLSDRPTVHFDPTGLQAVAGCWDLHITQVFKASGAAKKAILKAVNCCGQKGVMPPPVGDWEKWRKCMVKELSGVALDALAKFSCCCTQEWGGGGDPDTMRIEPTNCQQHCDWVACQGIASNPASVLKAGAYGDTAACYAKCDAEPDWRKW